MVRFTRSRGHGSRPRSRRGGTGWFIAGTGTRLDKRNRRRPRMRRSVRGQGRRAWWAPLLAVGVNGSAFAQIEVFQGLGRLSDGPGAYSYANDISSGDPLVVVGFTSSPGGGEAFRWTPGGGMVGLGDIPGGEYWSEATAVSADGQTVVGYSKRGVGPPDLFQGFAWTAGTGMVALKSFRIDNSTPNWQAHAWGVSADGSVVVGDCYKDDVELAHPCTWSAPFNHRPDLLDSGDPLNEFGHAYDISGDGSVIVGKATSYPVNGRRWENGAPQVIGDEWWVVSSDGTAMAGFGTPLDRGIWIVTGGFQPLAMTISDFNADGTVAVGHPDSGPGAVIWDATNGIRDLKTLLESDYGADLTGWTLTRATGVSDDGSMIVGFGINPAGGTEAWLVWLDGDEDEDGLRDSWETDGIDVDGDGTADLDLPALGADPMHKNLFVELDLMDGVTFPAFSKALVESAFAGAPLINPDTTTGITIRIDVDEANLTRVDDWPTDPTTWWPTGFDPYKAAHFGTPAERAHPLSGPLLAAKARVYRYAIGTYALDKKIGGIGERPGNDFVICIGKAWANDGTNDHEEKASLFMHELGHNLNLRHGGGDDVIGKPNYVSVMNYAFSYPYAWSAAFWTLDYSRLEMLPLDEAALDENAGIDSLGLYANFVMPFGVNVPVGGGGTARAIRYVHLDGRGTDFGDTGGTGLQDGLWDVGVAQDLNHLGPLSPIGGTSAPTPDEPMPGHDDWANIKLSMPFPPTGDYADGAHATAPTDELTEDDIAWINETFPSPTVCITDLDGDGMTGVIDLLALLGAWGTPDADLDGNEQTDVIDLLMLLAAWGTCP